MQKTIAAVLLLACLSCYDISEKIGFEPIFSFSDEVASLTQTNPFIIKTVTKDGISKLTKTQINWDKELALFRDAEINFSKFQSDYSIDTAVDGNKTIINCISESEKIKTRQVQYVFENNECKMIYMQRFNHDQISKTTQVMYYEPGVRYEINGRQKVREVSDVSYKVVGEFKEAEKVVFELLFKEEKLPFFVEFKEETAIIINGDERIVISDIKQEGDTIIMNIPVFNAELRYAKSSDKAWEGRWCNLSKGQYAIPLKVNNQAKTRFTVEKGNTKDFSGKWEVMFSPNTPDQYPGIGIFKQNGNTITGTFLTETGDYRYLEGNVDGNQLLLSCFDGAHAFLFKATQDEEGRLTGQFFSGKHWEEPWVASRNEKATLADPYSLTFMKNPEDKFLFAFPNLDSVIISQDDARYQNKVLVVQIMGSWCPNCMDETQFLSELYQKYKAQGLEMVSLCFEKSADFRQNKKSVEKLSRHFNTSHEYLIAGKASKRYAAEVLPQLNHIMSFPTTLIIDKKGKVRKIHTGFYGPGTGPYYDMYVESMQKTLEGLLAE